MHVYELLGADAAVSSLLTCSNFSISDKQFVYLSPHCYIPAFAGSAQGSNGGLRARYAFNVLSLILSDEICSAES